MTEVAGLVLAGDWIDTGLPATIEGAAISGRLAAEAILMNSVVVHYQEIALKGRNRPVVHRAGSCGISERRRAIST